MATRVNKFSSATRGTPVVAEEKGEERDSDQSAAPMADPAPADLDKNYRKQLIAYEDGKRCRAAGARLGELIHDDARLAAAWEAGWLGEPLPEFGSDGED